MADLAPFQGLRYSSRSDPGAVIAPPYDVLDDSDREGLLARNVHNVAAIDLPVAPSVMSAGGAKPADYVSAGERLRSWIAEGVLELDEASLYVHRMDWECNGTQRSTIGVIGALALPPRRADSSAAMPPGPEDVLPHEHTTPKASTDRLELTRATQANLSPIWVLTPSRGFSKILEQSDGPVMDTTTADGTRQRLWAVDDDASIRAIREALQPHPVVIADGHHRFGVALTYRDELVAAGRSLPGMERVLALVTELEPESVELHGIHRLIRRWPVGEDPLATLETWFEAEALSDDELVAPRLEHADAMALVTPTGRWLLRAHSGSNLGDFDTERLRVALENSGVSNVEYHHSERYVTNEVLSGHAAAAVVVRPPTIAQIMAVASGGDRMPPKSTFFSPKPPTGMVLRPLT